MWRYCHRTRNMERPVSPSHPRSASPRSLRWRDSLLVRRIGRLGPLLIAEMDQALADALGINTARYREAGRRAERERPRALANAGGAEAVLVDLRIER